MTKVDAAELLDELLSRWREERSSSLEVAIRKVAKKVEPHPAPTDQDAWVTLAQLDRARDLSALLETAHDCKKAAIPRRYDALRSRAADPRLGAFFLASIQDPPLLSQNKYPMYTAMFDALPELVDDRAIALLQDAADNPKGKSKFWGKLAKSIAKVIPELPAARRGKAIKVPKDLVVSKPSATKAEPLKPARERAPSLEGLSKQERPEGALDQLVDVWGRTRDPEIADMIDTLMVVIDLPVFEGDDAAWLKAAGGARPSSRAPLLATYAEAKTGQLIKRTRAMGSWSPDHRVSRALARVVADPLRGGNRELWDALYEALVVHIDPRDLDELKKRRQDIEGWRATDRWRAERAATREHTDAIIAAAEARVPLGRLNQRELKRFVPPTRKAPEGSANDSALVDAIVENWGDTGPIQVYADGLKERGDPRGEFVSLGLQLAAGKRVKGKRDKVLKKHRAAILGPLNEIINHFHWEFHNGLLQHAPIRLTSKSFYKTKAELDDLLTDSRWKTVESITPSINGSLAPILARAPLRRLRTLQLKQADELQALCAREVLPPLEELQISMTGRGWRVVKPLKRLKLKKLVVSAGGLTPVGVPSALRPLLNDVAELEVDNVWPILSKWLPALKNAQKVRADTGGASLSLYREGEVWDVVLIEDRIDHECEARHLLRDASAHLGTLTIEGPEPVERVAFSKWAQGA